jgi:hypothetical protein
MGVFWFTRLNSYCSLLSALLIEQIFSDFDQATINGIETPAFSRASAGPALLLRLVE